MKIVQLDVPVYEAGDRVSTPDGDGTIIDEIPIDSIEDYTYKNYKVKLDIPNRKEIIDINSECLRLL